MPNERKRNPLAAIIASLAFSLAVPMGMAALGGCEGDSATEDAVEDVGDGFEDAAEGTEDAAEEAADEVGE